MAVVREHICENSRHRSGNREVRPLNLTWIRKQRAACLKQKTGSWNHEIGRQQQLSLQNKHPTHLKPARITHSCLSARCTSRRLVDPAKKQAMHKPIRQTNTRRTLTEFHQHQAAIPYYSSANAQKKATAAHEQVRQSIAEWETKTQYLYRVRWAGCQPQLRRKTSDSQSGAGKVTVALAAALRHET